MWTQRGTHRGGSSEKRLTVRKKIRGEKVLNITKKIEKKNPTTGWQKNGRHKGGKYKKPRGGHSKSPAGEEKERKRNTSNLKPNDGKKTDQPQKEKTEKRRILRRMDNQERKQGVGRT